MAPNDTPDWTSVTQVETVPGSVVQTASLYVPLGSVTVTATVTRVADFTASASFSGLHVLVSTSTGGINGTGAMAWDLTALGTQTTFDGVMFGGAWVSSSMVVHSGAVTMRMACRATDTIRVKLVGGTGHTVVTAWGMTGDPGVRTRSDGRNCPVGASAVGTYTHGSSGTIVGAPAAPARFLLSSLSVAGTTGALVEVMADIAGATAAVVSTLAKGSPAVVTWEHGLLCGPGTGVSWTTTGTAAYVAAACVYDVVA